MVWGQPRIDFPVRPKSSHTIVPRSMALGPCTEQFHIFITYFCKVSFKIFSLGYGDSRWLSDSAHTIGLTLATKLVHCQTDNSRGHPLCSSSHQNKWLKPCRQCV